MEAESASETFLGVIKMRIQKMRKKDVFLVKEIRRKSLDLLYLKIETK